MALRPCGATRILGFSVEADLDGGGEATCVVDSDVGIAMVRARVTGPDGAEAATVKAKAEFSVNWSAPETRKAELEFKVDQPKLWSDEMPAMYGAQVDLLDATGGLLAHAEARFAFKRLEVRRDDGLYLNGQRLRLRGINAPVDIWPDDTAARAAACRDAVRDVKGLNANAIWCTNSVPAELTFATRKAYTSWGGSRPSRRGVIRASSLGGTLTASGSCSRQHMGPFAGACSGKA